MWMPSLDLATGLWARMRRTLYTLFSRLSRAAQRFWMSRAYFPVLLTVSAAFMAAGEPVYGVVALGCIVIWLLAACPDLLAPVCPFFMAFLMSSQCYGQLTDFLPCAALVPPLAFLLVGATVFAVGGCCAAQVCFDRIQAGAGIREGAHSRSSRVLNSTARRFSGILPLIYNEGGVIPIWILTAVTIRVTS